MPVYSLPGWFLYALLIPALCLKENRSRQAWAILLPLLVLVFPASQCIWEPVTLVCHAVVSFAVCQALLWLLAYKLPSGRLVKSFLAAALVMAAVGVLGTLARPRPEAATHAVVYGTASLSLLLGLTIAAAFCRKRYTKSRFTWRFLLWITVVCAACMAVIAALEGGKGADIAMSVLFGGPIYGVLIYLLALPFMVVVFRVPLYRARLMAWLGLEPARDGQAGERRKAEEDALEG